MKPARIVPLLVLALVGIGSPAGAEEELTLDCGIRIVGDFTVVGSPVPGNGSANVNARDILIFAANADLEEGVVAIEGSGLVTVTCAGEALDCVGTSESLSAAEVGVFPFEDAIIEVVAKTLTTVDVVCGDDDGGGGGEDPPVTSTTGFMTGGGTIGDDSQATHGFQLRCGAEDLPQRLQVNWGPGNSFHLEELLSVACTGGTKEKGDFDTLRGEGFGRCNGTFATAEWELTDLGEPGTRDSASIEINGSSTACDLVAEGNLDHGNHQAHHL